MHTSRRRFLSRLAGSALSVAGICAAGTWLAAGTGRQGGIRPLRPPAETMTVAASSPTPPAIKTAGMANCKVLPIASVGATNTAEALGGLNSRV